MAQHRGECQETAGFLFSHACGDPGVDSCTRCGKTICPRHTVTEEKQKLCTGCGKQAMRAHPDGKRPARYRDDPYFYSYHHYPGTYYWDDYDRDDFTDADQAGFGRHEATAGDAAAFEDDMGGS